MTYYSTMDSFTYTTTKVVCIIILLVSLFLIHEIVYNTNIPAIGTFIFLHVLFLFAYFSISGKYVININSLEIKSKLFTVRISFKDIDEAWIASGENDPLIRVVAFGGVFGYAGVFFNNTLGRVNVFGRRLTGERIVIKLVNGKTYLIFPDDTYAMFFELKDAMDN